MDTATTQEFEIGKVYKIKHSRKGTFTIEVTAMDDTWVSGWIMNGTANAIMDYNVKQEGDDITLRISFCTILEQVTA
jgi:hypothetical protein